MRKSFVLGSFAAIAAGSVGAGALDSVPNMLGADGLKDITSAIISSCTALGTYQTDNDGSTAGVQPIFYRGTGSTNGESNLASFLPPQWVAPMTRPLSTGICNSATSHAGAEGVVFALDSLDIVFGPNNPPATAGLDYTGTTVGNPNNNWRTVLREVYTGMGASGNNIFLRDCNGPNRRNIINNWNALFKGGTNGGGTCSTDSNPDVSWTEAGLRHAFRRTEEAGDSDVLLAQLGLPLIDFEQVIRNDQFNTSIIPTNSSATQREIYRALANSSFCNVKRPEDTYGPVTKEGSMIPPMYNVGVPASVARPSASGFMPYDASLGDNARFLSPFMPETMDQDPVRRKCFGSGVAAKDSPGTVREEVCSADGFLGVVLPIEIPTGVRLSSLYPTAACEDTLDFEFGPSPTRPTGDAVRCPNGDAPSDGKCYLPTRTEPSQPNGYAFDCLNFRFNVPAAIFDQDGNGADFPDAPNTDGLGDADGRAYNLIMRNPDGSIITHQRPNPAALGEMTVPTTNAFFRIHTSRGGTAATKVCNHQDNATDAIGCLVQANPCSIGYAGGGALANNPGTVSARLNGIASTTATVQALMLGGTVYPLARKLFVNSSQGFQALAASDPNDPNNTRDTGKDAELDLVKCFTALPFQTTTTSIGSPINVASPFGFVPLPAPVGAANGQPTTTHAICADFNDSACSGVTGNTDACIGNPSGIPSSACDNGYQDGDETGVDVCPAARPTCNTMTHRCQ